MVFSLFKPNMLVKSARLGDAKPFDTPLELNVKIGKAGGILLEDPTVFRRLVGSLLYLTMTRPDISHIVHTVSQFVSNPLKPHIITVHRILRYIKGTSAILLRPLYIYKHMPTVIGLVIRITIDLPQVGACSLATLPLHGNAKGGYCF